jgi:hypothetical protein
MQICVKTVIGFGLSCMRTYDVVYKMKWKENYCWIFYTKFFGFNN